jgi:predicted site-specific integrase-resolvase
MTSEYIPAKQAKELYGIDIKTLKLKVKEGFVRILTVAKRVLYHSEDVKILHLGNYVVYVSDPNKENMVYQLAMLDRYIKQGCKLIQDQDGYYFKSDGFQELLRLIKSHSIDRVIILDEETVGFGRFDFFKYYCDEHGVKVDVLAECWRDKLPPEIRQQMIDSIIF